MRRTVLLVLPLLVAVSGCSRLFDGETYTMPSSSMEPTLMRGDRLGCSKDVPDTLKRGMVIAFVRPEGWGGRGDDDRYLVKRVVGLPGERIESKDGRDVLVNGERVEEPYLKGPDQDLPTFGETTVPEGQYFVLGDNRDGSSDSRFSGPVPHASVEAVCTEIVAPRDRKGRIPGT